jgi:rhomboid protease GluP
MLLKNQYVQSQIVLHLLKEDFELLQINEHFTEYLLVKRSRNVHKVLFVSTNQYNWANELHKRIKFLEEKYIKSQTNKWSKKNLTFHHIFITDYPPVDEWERYEGTTYSRYVHLVTENMELNEWIKMLNLLEVKHIAQVNLSHEMMEIDQKLQESKQEIISIHHNKQEEIRALYQQGKPIWTYVFIAINCVMFILLEISGGSTSIETLLTFGAKYNHAIVTGEWWRIFTSMFLHIGFIHIILNMLALYYVGTLVERIFGNSRFLIIYLLSGFIGGLASFAFNDSIAAGASGAIFGLFGALLCFGTQYPKVFFRTLGWNVILVIAMNVVLGFSVAQIDNSAHLGGLIGGFISAYIVMFRQKKNMKWQIVASISYIILAIGLIGFGTVNEKNHYNGAVELHAILQLIEQEKYEETIHYTSELLPYMKEYENDVLFYRAYATIQIGEYDKAIIDLEQIVANDPKFEEAMFNLSLLYLETNQLEKSTPLIKQLNDIDPENEKYQQLEQYLQ